MAEEIGSGNVSKERENNKWSRVNSKICGCWYLIPKFVVVGI
jgi:hypothetical protein